MENTEKINEEPINKDDLGFMLWQLESIENFFPCYQSMIKRE